MPQMIVQSAQATAALRQSPLAALRKLSIQETDASVMILGRVPSYYLKQLAQETIMPVLGGVVSPNVFPLLNARPSIGRTFTADDDRLGATPVVVLGYGLWSERFAQDRAILGKLCGVTVLGR